MNTNPPAAPSAPVQPLATAGESTFVPGPLSTTTRYEVIQKLCNSANGPCQIIAPSTTKSTAMTLNSPNLTVASTTGLLVGMGVSGTGIPAGAVIINIASATALVISANATQTATGVTLTYGNTWSNTAVLTYQQNWQNTNAFAPMFDVPANVVTFGVGTPYNALNFLEKFFVATTVPPLAGFADTAYNTAPRGTPAALQGDFGAGDPRTRITALGLAASPRHS